MSMRLVTTIHEVLVIIVTTVGIVVNSYATDEHGRGKYCYTKCERLVILAASNHVCWQKQHDNECHDADGDHWHRHPFVLLDHPPMGTARTSCHQFSVHLCPTVVLVVVHFLFPFSYEITVMYESNFLPIRHQCDVVSVLCACFQSPSSPVTRPETVLSCSLRCPNGGIGRRGRLKTCYWQQCVGSSPTWGTIVCGCRPTAGHQPSKLSTRVRVPSSAPCW